MTEIFHYLQAPSKHSTASDRMEVACLCYKSARIEAVPSTQKTRHFKMIHETRIHHTNQLNATNSHSSQAACLTSKPCSHSSKKIIRHKLVLVCPSNGPTPCPRSNRRARTNMRRTLFQWSDPLHKAFVLPQSSLEFDTP